MIGNPTRAMAFQRTLSTCCARHQSLRLRATARACRGRYRWNSVATLLATSRSSALRDSAVIAAVAAFSFIPWLGRLHLFDWDEINFAEGAREMLVTGNYRDVQIEFQPFAEKPPLFMWVQ